MLLAVDVRNGSVAVGVKIDLRKEGEASVPSAARPWVCRFRLSTADRSADEWAFLMLSMLREAGVDPRDVRRTALSSAVPAYTARFRDALARFSQAATETIVVGPGVRTGLRIKTDNPAEVGADLVCNAVAASSALKSPCLVVDFGTVLSFTAVDKAGDLAGVAIAPGLEAAAADLRERAAQLPQVRLDAPLRAIGKNSTESIRAGVMIGWSGLVDRLIEEVSAELGSPALHVSLVGTGDYETAPVPVSRHFDLWDRWLTLDGLAIIADRNLP
jgi:type III pantothenate kinase